jgi:biotin operon repressor
MARRKKAGMRPTTLAVWKAITLLIDENGYPPSQEEIAEEAFIGRTSVALHISYLEAEGILETGRGWRTIHLLRRHPDVPLPEPEIE